MANVFLSPVTFSVVNIQVIFECQLVFVLKMYHRHFCWGEEKAGLVPKQQIVGRCLPSVLADSLEINLSKEGLERCVKEDPIVEAVIGVPGSSQGKDSH